MLGFILKPIIVYRKKSFELFPFFYLHKKGNNSNKMLDRVVFSCQQNGVNTFYKCIEFQVNSFDSY